MPLNAEQAKTLVKMVEATRDRELTCEECLREIAEFVEIQLASKPLSNLMREVENHLHTCPCCEEEVQLLRRAVAALEEPD